MGKLSMRDEDLLSALRRLKVETGSIACLGCGYEHSCGVHGCAVIRMAAETLQRFRWIAMTEQAPREGELVLVSDGVFVFEAYLDRFGIWHRSYGVLLRLIGGPVTHWMPLPQKPGAGLDE